jgi:putative flippase GtrA
MLNLLYLLLTNVGLGHKTAMTFLYLLGTAQTFVFNKRWTFSHRGDVTRSMWRYLTIYVIGYLLNLITLTVFVDGLGWPHALVQGAAILILGVVLFLAQNYWVFGGSARRFSSWEMAFGNAEKSPCPQQRTGQDVV